ncbi:hypothetical protein M378DRAFT_167330 [Amanita muscaria Koide BX008]|uniref:Uncharacterized protein n=1 Tax=Amanita muscaria (strain Koide BX008) TaxID=946122 RepID=A0A0C2SDP1_AMAMK|nr:hypothetical protein M378DRAFT_167330 [Amanita muscaria Koide BX008]
MLNLYVKLDLEGYESLMAPSTPAPRTLFTCPGSDSHCVEVHSSIYLFLVGFLSLLSICCICASSLICPLGFPTGIYIDHLSNSTPHGMVN